MEDKVYTQEEVDKIKEDTIHENNMKMFMELAKKFNKTVSDNLIASNKKNFFTSGFSQEQVTRYLADPIGNEQNLRKLSTILFTMSPQYQQIINYFSSICKYVPVVTPNLYKFTDSKGNVDDKKLKKEYIKATSELDKMNIHHEFQRITGVLIREDVYYGYVHESANSFYCQQLNSDYCRISSTTDGVFNFQFNFAYFDANKSVTGLDIPLIETYPEEFQKKYKLYLKDKRGYQWQELSEENSICIKILEDIPFPMGPYTSLFNDLSDLNSYKEMAKLKTEMDNYKFVGLEMPLNDNSDKPNDFKVDIPTAMQFYSMILDGMPEGIGAFISAVPFKDIDFSGNSNSTNVSDRVKDAEDNIYSSAGVGGVNVGRNATNNSAILASNTVDSARLFKLYRQFERWLNRKFKREYNGRFTVQLLDVTQHNLDDTIDRYLKLAQYGVPVKLQLSALLGVSQQSERGLAYLEDYVLDITNTWKPLVSSHTQTNNEEVGSDGSNAKKNKDLSDEGARSRERDIG